MTTPPISSRQEPPVSLDGVPEEEGVSVADAADRVDLDPDEQPNRSESGAQPAAEFPEGDRS